MKNKLKLIGLIAIMIAAAFSFAACDLLGEEDKGCGCCSECSDTCQGDCCSNCKKGKEQGNNNITITVTGNFNEFNGKKAAMLVYTGSDPVAWANFIDVAPGATSLTFTILDYVTDESFKTAGTYNVLLWFREGNNKETDVEYFKMNQSITTGTNTIQFSTFPLLNGDDDVDDYSDLYGSWIKDNFYENARLTLVISEGYLGFISESLMGGGGTSYSFDIISYEGTTMTLDDYEGPFTIEVYINSDGKIVISGFESHDGTYTNEDDYIYEVFTPPDTATSIMEDIWYRGSFSSLDEAPQWFTFDAEEGETYKIYINDTDWIEDYYLTDVAMNIYFNGKKLNYGNVDPLPDFESFFEFDADEDGTVYVEVIPYGSWGKFDVGYNSAGGRGDLIWELSESFWIFGNFDYASEIGYVIEAKAGTTYSIWLDDKDKTSSKIDVVMSVGFMTGDTGTVLFEEDNISKYEYTPAADCRIYILITPLDYNNKDGDNFEIVFTTNGENPGKG